MDARPNSVGMSKERAPSAKTPYHGQQQAIDTPRDQLRLALESEHYDAFLRLLDNPPAPGPKLMALFRRVPAWRK